MGLNKRAHYSSLLKALVVPAVDDIIMDNSQRLYKNIFKANTPSRDQQSALLCSCMIQGTTIKGNLLDRVIKAGADLLKLLSRPFQM